VGTRRNRVIRQKALRFPYLAQMRRKFSRIIGDVAGKSRWTGLVEEAILAGPHAAARQDVIGLGYHMTTCSESTYSSMPAHWARHSISWLAQP
jgi:hypothetical protein